jgi:hypothetical protein
MPDFCILRSFAVLTPAQDDVITIADEGSLS